jgi:hypothetical protein
MTLAQAANIHAKWKQHGEPRCEHPIQELVRLARSADGFLLGTYHCRECGEAVIYIHKSPPFSTTPESACSAITAPTLPTNISESPCPSMRDIAADIDISIPRREVDAPVPIFLGHQSHKLGSTLNGPFQIFARRMRRVKARIRTMLLG